MGTTSQYLYLNLEIKAERDIFEQDHSIEDLLHTAKYAAFFGNRASLDLELFTAPSKNLLFTSVSLLKSTKIVGIVHMVAVKVLPSLYTADTTVCSVLFLRRISTQVPGQSAQKTITGSGNIQGTMK